MTVEPFGMQTLFQSGAQAAATGIESDAGRSNPAGDQGDGGNRLF